MDQIVHLNNSSLNHFIANVSTFVCIKHHHSINYCKFIIKRGEYPPKIAGNRSCKLWNLADHFRTSENYMKLKMPFSRFDRKRLNHKIEYCKKGNLQYFPLHPLLLKLTCIDAFLTNIHFKHPRYMIPVSHFCISVLFCCVTVVHLNDYIIFLFLFMMLYYYAYI